MNAYCTYLRVSTQRQGAQGLGISAQRAMCDNFIKQNNGEHTHEFMDVESGTHRERKGLWDAIDYCKKNNCSLVIAKLDRLARDVEFTFRVINTGIDIHFTDMPVVNSMILGVFAAVAQYEREMCSKRTKDALAAKKAKGEKVGGACLKWRQAFINKSQKEKEEIQLKKGESKRTRFQESRDVQTFKEILRREFPKQTKDEDPKNWRWAQITCRQPHLDNMLNRMQEYKMIDNTLFAKWNLDLDCGQKLRNYLHTLQRSYNRNQD